MTTFGPIAIFVGVAATFALVFFTFWERLNVRATGKAKGLATHLDRAGLKLKPEEVVLTIVGVSAVIWITIALTVHPPLVVGILLIPATALLVAGGFYAWVNLLIKKRLEAFVQQLELALRMMASGVRVGLGLRQALTLVIEEIPQPSKHEYMRVIGQTNLGVSILDAIDDLATRMPSHEALMMARAIRIQTQTGGDLGAILEHLASTIKDRRRVNRKIGTLTAESRMSAMVLMIIPLAIGLFIIGTQADIRHALLFTPIGHGVLITLVVLEAGGYFWLKKILKVDV